MATFLKRIFFVNLLAVVLLVGVLAGLMMTSDAARAEPEVLFVSANGSGDCSQGDPCDLATSLSISDHGDSIYLAVGVYTGTGSAVVTVTKSITMFGGWDGAPTGEVVRDPESYPTTLDGQRERRVIFISGNITPTIDGFMITRGNATGLVGYPYNLDAGGGIYSEYANPLISNNLITDNLASSRTDSYGRGGGIHIARASSAALITGNTIVSNTGSTADSGFGGGAYIFESELVFMDNRVLSNTGSMVDWSWGGGLMIGISATQVIDNEFRWNTAGVGSGTRGAGIMLDRTASIIKDNFNPGKLH